MASFRCSTRLWTVVVSTLVLVSLVNCRIHHLSLKDDIRNLIPISTFGFYKRGVLEVKIHSLFVKPLDLKKPFGFTVDRTATDGMNPYSRNMENECLFQNERTRDDDSFGSIKLHMDVTKNKTVVKCSNDLTSGIRIYTEKSKIPMSPGSNRRVAPGSAPFTNVMTRQKRNGSDADDSKKHDYDYNDDDESSESESGRGTIGVVPAEAAAIGAKASDPNAPDTAMNDDNVDNLNKPSISSENPSVADVASGNDGNTNDKASDSNENGGFRDPGLPAQSLLPETNYVPDRSEIASCDGRTLTLNATVLPDGTVSYSMTFVVYIEGEGGEGLYNLYFHNCDDSMRSKVTLNMSITEENEDSDGKNYLSAGEMPLPALYFMMSVLFLTAGCLWVVVLKKSRKETGVFVYKIHYLMTALVFAKSLSLFFHSMNYHYIQMYGTHVEGWAVLYYITHLVKGALLFITILLIGTGYAFVKHLLSDKDKKLFMIVIPLQVLANVAQIIIEESEQGEMVHTTWTFIFISVDLLCCGAILFPVVWSIRHLQEASQTDGKAAANLRKLKLFRHFYIMVVCYIYFTRIIVQLLLRITVPFKYEWVDDMFREMTTFIFFVLTGYKFRPASNNPYLELAHDSDEEADMDIALTESGLTSGLSKRGFKPKKKTLKEIVLFDPNEDDSDDDEEVLLEKREASHDFD